MVTKPFAPRPRHRHHAAAMLAAGMATWAFLQAIAVSFIPPSDAVLAPLAQQREHDASGRGA